MPGSASWVLVDEEDAMDVAELASHEDDIVANRCQRHRVSQQATTKSPHEAKKKES